MKVEPLGRRVAVARLAAKQRTESGIYVPDDSVEKRAECEVLAVGPLVKNEIDPGDIVVIGAYSGTEVRVDGEPLIIVHEREILARHTE